MKKFWHPKLDEILTIHESVLEQDGGSSGIRSQELLESALAAPKASFGGKPIIGDGIEIAAAYLYYLCKNHPFVDGNKRVALVTSVTFLRLNGYDPAPDSADWEQLVIDVAASKLDRVQTTVRLTILIRE